ncbi:MAG TPA: hypothetical protein VG206_04400 [Terriglobia bacterium]|nr:hypothetical protein [Terriglobia bacterium]
MPSAFDPHEPYFRIRIVGSEDSFPSLLDLSSFLFDFNLLYEITRLATDVRYHDFRFSNYALFRKGRPLKAGDRLHVEELVAKSPLVLVTDLTIAAGAIGALWGVVQIAEKIVNAPLNRRKLKAEVEKLERENQFAPGISSASDGDDSVESPEGVRTILRSREAEHYYDNVAGRLQRSSVRIKEFEIEVVPRRRKLP